MSMGETQVKLKIRIHSDEGINLAELGVICTGINRAISVAAGLSGATIAKEPQGLSVTVESVERGSVVITSLVDFFNNQVAQDAFLASVLGNATFELIGNLATNVRKALTRTKPDGSDSVRVRIEPTLRDQNTVVEVSNKNVNAIEDTLAEEEKVKSITVEVSMNTAGGTHSVALTAIVPIEARRISIRLQ